MRGSALLKVAIGAGAAFALWILAQLVPFASEHLSADNPFVYGPIIYCVVGMIELIGNVPFTSLASRWDSMPQRQQTICGLLGILLGGALVVGLIDMYFHFIH